MNACSLLHTDLSREEARTVLEPFFEAARELFLEAGLERCVKTKLVVSGKMHDTPRHFAACRDDGLLIYVAPQMVELPDHFVVGIMAHEFGHAVDFLYPGEFRLRGEAAAREAREAVGPKQWARVLRTWQRVHESQGTEDMDQVERLADAIAASVYGAPIGYGGPCRLQTFQGGETPRPEGLR